MKKILLLILTLLSSLFTFHCLSQPAIQWEKCLGGSGTDNGSAIIQTNDGGYLACGFSNSHNGDLNNTNSGGAWVVKLDSNGSIQWQKSYGGSSYGDFLYSIVQTNDGGYVLAGYTESTDGDLLNSGNHGNVDMWVLKIDDTGLVQWSKCYGGSGIDYGFCIKQTTDGGYIFTGETESNDGDIVGNHGFYDVWVVKLNDTGTIQWSKCYGGSDQDESLSIIQTTDGGYIFAATTASVDGDVPVHIYGSDWIVKLDSVGTIQWDKCYGGTNGSGAEAILQTPDGGYLVASQSASNDGDVHGNHGGYDYWLYKLTDTGAIQWSNSYGGSYDEYVYSLVKTMDGKYAAVGYTYSDDGNVNGNHNLNNSGEDYWVIKVDTNGTFLWGKCLGSTLDDQAFCLAGTSDNGLVVTGETNGNNGDITGNHGGQYDYWVVKLAPDSMVGINEVQSAEGVKLYPNPVSETLTIRNYELGIRSEELKIMDVLGNIVYHQTLNNSNQFTIDVSGFSNGMYFYRITSAKETMQGKFVVEK